MILFVTACSGSPPQISRISSQLLWVDDLLLGRKHESLSLHVVANDEDGFEDIELLHLISDETELYWTLDTESWTLTEAEQEQWIGSNRITMADLAPLPRGDYRLLLADLGGDMDEEIFTLETAAIKPESIPFPRAEIGGDRIVVEGIFDSYTLLVFTTADEFVKSVEIASEPGSIRGIKSGDSSIRRGFTFWVYVYWERRGGGLLVGPYSVE